MKKSKKTMTKRCIGIDIGSSYLSAVQIAQTDRELRIEKVFTLSPEETTNSTADILETLLSQHGFDRQADIAISLPHDAVFFRNLQTDAAGAEQKDPISNSALEHNFPIPLEEIVVQKCSRRRLSEEKFSVLVAAVKRESLRERLSTFAGAKMYPARIEAIIFAVHSTALINHPDIATGRAIITYLNDSFLQLAITQDNDILMVRNIPIVSGTDDNTSVIQEHIAELLSCEVEITWQKLFGEKIEKETKIYHVSQTNTSDDLKAIVEEKLNCRMIIVDPYAKVICPAQYNSNSNISVAEGLALALLAPDKTNGVNFLEAENSNIKPKLDMKKELVIYAVLLASIVVVSLTGLFIRLSHLETKYAQLKKQSRKVFQLALPKETIIVNPLIQLQQKLQSLRNDHRLFSPVSTTGLSPLEVLHAIIKTAPSDTNLNINSLLITTDSVRLTGAAQSFEAVYDWQRSLERIHGFSNIDVQNTKKEHGNQMVNFTMSISLAAGEDK